MSQPEDTDNIEIDIAAELGAEEASSQVFSIYIKPDEFAARLRPIREFLHRMGRETRQGEVAYEFDGRFYRIRQFDSP